MSHVFRFSRFSGLRSFGVIFFLRSLFLYGKLEDFRLKSYYIYPFSWHLLLWFFCLCWGSETFSELHVCSALLELVPFWESLQAVTVFVLDWFLEGSLFVWTLRISTVKVFFLNFRLQHRFQWCCLQGLCKSMFASLSLSCSVMLFFQTPKVFLSDIHVQILIESFLDNALISQRYPILSGLFFGCLPLPSNMSLSLLRFHLWNPQAFGLSA